MDKNPQERISLPQGVLEAVCWFSARLGEPEACDATGVHWIAHDPQDAGEQGEPETVTLLFGDGFASVVLDIADGDVARPLIEYCAQRGLALKTPVATGSCREDDTCVQKASEAPR